MDDMYEETRSVYLPIFRPETLPKEYFEYLIEYLCCNVIEYLDNNSVNLDHFRQWLWNEIPEGHAKMENMPPMREDIYLELSGILEDYFSEVHGQIAGSYKWLYNENIVDVTYYTSNPVNGKNLNDYLIAVTYKGVNE